MIINTKAIVLATVRYKDHAVIVNCYTKDHGVKSYLVHGIFKSKKGKMNPAYFQLLTQLEIQASHHPNKELHKLKEVRINQHYQSLHSNIYKSSVVMFLAEALNNLIKDEDTPELYEFIETALLWYDLHEFNPNFHLLFLLKLSRHLGIYPNLEEISSEFMLNLNDLTQVSLLEQLLGTTFDDLENIKMNAQMRQQLLTSILKYFSVHLGYFKTPKSLEILHHVFK